MASIEYRVWFEEFGDIGSVLGPTELFKEEKLLQAIGIRLFDAGSVSLKYTVSVNGNFYGFEENGNLIGTKETGRFINGLVIIVNVNSGLSGLFTSLPNMDCQIKPRGGNWQSVGFITEGKTRTYKAENFGSGIEGLKIILS